MNGSSTPDNEALVAAARDAAGRAYAPYSQFRVGAAVVDGDGRVYTGANVENASYGLTICAERVAIFAAVSAGAREIVEIAVFTQADPPASPCGACRQVLREFGPRARVTLANDRGRRVETDVAALLPMSFGPNDLAHRL